MTRRQKSAQSTISLTLVTVLILGPLGACYRGPQVTTSDASRSGLGGPPPAPEAGAGQEAFVDEEQAAWGEPVDNFGAFHQAIPLPVPPGVRGLQPDLSLAYSSNGNRSRLRIRSNVVGKKVRRNAVQRSTCTPQL